MRIKEVFCFVAIILSCVTVSFAAEEAASSGVSGNYKTFGAPARLSDKPLTLAEALDPKNLSKLVRVEGRVTGVCQKKGCWMMLTDGKNEIRTTFKDYGFFVPKDIAGKTVIAEGIISEKVTPESEARHYAEDAGRSADEVKKIVGDQKGFAFVAETVLIPE